MGSSCKSLSGRCYLHASQLSETEPLPFIMPHQVQTSPSRNFQLRCKARPQHGHQQFADHFQPPRNQEEPVNLNVCSPATPGCALCQSGRHGWQATAGPEPSPHSCAGSSANSQFAPPPFPCPHQAQSFTSRKGILEVKTLYVQ